MSSLDLKKNIKEAIDNNKEAYMSWLLELLKIPSISADTARSDMMLDCAAAVVRIMTEAGIDAGTLNGYRAPAVYGHYDEGAPTTLLVYGHYDVQPPEPLEAWRTSPFEPLICDGVIYARGVADNKGQFLAHIAAFDVLKKLAKISGSGKIGCNLRFLIEGGEEVGSPDLSAIFCEHRDCFDVDAAFSADALQHANGQPFILPGLKGGMTVQLSAKGPRVECHGAMADIVPNPLWRIIHALNAIKPSDTEIMVPGFYDNIVPLSCEEERLLSAAPNPIEQVRSELGLTSLLPQAEENFHISRTMPTCNVSLITDGNDTGKPRFSLPTEAKAVLRMNLVPNQDPDDIALKLRAYLNAEGFADVEMSVLSETPPSMTDVSHPYVQYAADIARDAFEREPLIYPRVIGSGPDYHFTQKLGVPSVWVPYAGADAETHAPNENMTVKAFLEGICCSALFFSRSDEWRGSR